MSLAPVELLAGLLAEYSPSAQEAGAVDYLVNAMRTLDFKAGVDGAGNAVGSLGDGPREILLLGHIDTVPGFIPVACDGDILRGRGAVDAKGPLAAFTAAAARTGARPGWKITVVGAVGEEGNSPGARYWCDHNPPAEMVVIGEPSGWDHVCLGYKGSLWLGYTLQQPLAHTAARVTGGCEEAIRFWYRLQSFAEEWNLDRPKFFDQLTPSLRGMHSENDGFLETARLAVNLRLPPEFDCGPLMEKLNALAAPGRLEIEDCTPAYRAEKNTPLVRAFLAAIRASGGQPGFSLKTGTSDMNILGPEWGCPIVAYGPGDSNLDHTPEEHILVSEYLKGVEVLTRALELIVR